MQHHEHSFIHKRSWATSGGNTLHLLSFSPHSHHHISPFRSPNSLPQKPCPLHQHPGVPLPFCSGQVGNRGKGVNAWAAWIQARKLWGNKLRGPDLTGSTFCAFQKRLWWRQKILRCWEQTLGSQGYWQAWEGETGCCWEQPEPLCPGLWSEAVSRLALATGNHWRRLTGLTEMCLKQKRHSREEGQERTKECLKTHSESLYWFQ